MWDCPGKGAACVDVPSQPGPFLSPHRFRGSQESRTPLKPSRYPGKPRREWAAYTWDPDYLRGWESSGAWPGWR